MSTNYILVIPARYKSTRFPGKPLIDILGKTMLERVYEKCIEAVESSKIFVATDDKRIEKHCIERGIQCIITSTNCLTGTDRIGEVAKTIDADFYLNVQGDEPIFNPLDINILIKQIEKSNNNYDVFCGFCPIDDSERFFSKDVPKVIFNKNQELIYISRSPIPGNKNGKFNFGFRQVCAYAFSKKSLMSFYSTKEKTPLEEQEDIELLRFLELGYKVKMLKMSNVSIPVDREEDLKRVLGRL